MSTFQKLTALASTHSLPLAFHTDLSVHDQAAISRHPGRPFVWVLYESGTVLMWTDQIDYKLVKMLGSIRDVVEGGAHKWFACDGHNVTPTTFDTLRAQLTAASYTSRVVEVLS